MIELVQVTKEIRHQTVLDQISCEIPDGSVAGLLGPNHSGKSILLFILAGFMKKTSGEIHIPTSAFVPSENSLPLYLTLQEILHWYPVLYPDTDKSQAKSFCDEYLPDASRPLSQFSQGDLAKLNLILGCSRQVGLFLLDEPLQSIDENAKSLLVSLIAACPNKESVFLISSHDPKEYEKILDQALFLKQGKLVANEKPDQLRSRQRLSITDFYRKVMNSNEDTSV